MEKRMNIGSEKLVSKESENRSADEVATRLYKHQMRLRTVRVPQYPPFYTTLAAIVFLLGGITFLIAGLVVRYGPDSGRGLPMIILGSIMFIPGSYSSFILYGAWKGWEGYDYNQVPSYDTD